MKDINYYRTISNSLNCTQQQSDLYESQNALLYDFDTNPSCKTVLLNDVETNVLLYIETDIVTGGQSYKVRCKPNQILKIGDILNIDNEIWFVTKVDINKFISYAGTLAKATCILKFYKNGIYRELPCYINIGTRNYINERDNDFLRLPKSLYTAYCPDLGYLNKQDANMRFVIRGYVYRAVGIDNLTVLDNEIRDGLIIMKLQDDSIRDDDNMELEIANYWSQQQNDNKSQKSAIDDVHTQPYTASIDFQRDSLLCGEVVSIKSIIQNIDGNDITTDRIFYVTDENDKQVEYIQNIKYDDVSIKFKIKNDGKYIGKKVKLKIIYPQLYNMIFEKVFTINSIV